MDCGRTAIIAIATLAVIQVTGCGGGASKSTTSAETLPATTTPVATTPAVSDTTVRVPEMPVAVPDPTVAVSVVPVSAVTTQLQAAVDEAVRAAPSIPGLVVHVEAPGRHLGLRVAAGLADRATATPLTSDAGFRIASNTKTFTAAAILRLVEQGRLSLDTPIAGLDAPETVDALRADGYRVDSITVRHLLQHTSGIYNYGKDPAYETAVAAEPAKRWTRLEQVRFAVDHGDPLGEPGTMYAYSDTGYALLGEILERVTGTSLGDAYRTLLGFERLHLDAT